MQDHFQLFCFARLTMSLIQAKKVAEHKRKYERRRETKEIDAKRERVRKAQEAYAKAQQEENERRAREREQNTRAPGGQNFPGIFVEPMKYFM